MNKRPLPVTIIAIALIATGAGGLAFHSAGFSAHHLFQYDVAWIASHVVLSFFHSLFQARSAHSDLRGLRIFPVSSSGRRIFSPLP